MLDDGRIKSTRGMFIGDYLMKMESFERGACMNKDKIRQVVGVDGRSNRERNISLRLAQLKEFSITQGYTFVFI